MVNQILIDEHAHALGVDLKTIRTDAQHIVKELMIWVMFSEYVVDYNTETLRYQSATNFVLQLLILVGTTISFTLAVCLHSLEWYLIFTTAITVSLQLALTLNTTHYWVLTASGWIGDTTVWDKRVHTQLTLLQNKMLRIALNDTLITSQSDWGEIDSELSSIVHDNQLFGKCKLKYIFIERYIHMVDRLKVARILNCTELLSRYGKRNDQRDNDVEEYTDDTDEEQNEKSEENDKVEEYIGDTDEDLSEESEEEIEIKSKKKSSKRDIQDNGAGVLVDKVISKDLDVVQNEDIGDEDDSPIHVMIGDEMISIEPTGSEGEEARPSDHTTSKRKQSKRKVNPQQQPSNPPRTTVGIFGAPVEL